MRDLYELLREVEGEGLHPRGSTRQMQALARVVTHYETKAKRLQPEQAAIYDQLFLALSDGADASARAGLARTLAGFVRSPRAIAERLAAEEEAQVAAPLLEHAQGLQEDFLVAMAERRGNAHLAALARRARLPASVSRRIAERADDAVVETLALNGSALFDEASLAVLVRRAETSAGIRAAALCRSDFPTAHSGPLLARDLDAIRAQIDGRGRVPAGGADTLDGARLAALLVAALADAGRERYDVSRLAPHVAFVEQRIATRRIEERHLARWIERLQSEDAIAFLAARSGLPASHVQRLLFAQEPLAITILVRALGFGWTTLKALALQVFPRIGIAEQCALYATFDALRPDDARALVRHAALHCRLRVFSSPSFGAAARHPLAEHAYSPAVPEHA